LGWDAELKRKLAVPLAVRKVKSRAIKTRILKDSQDVEDIRVLATLAENRLRLDRLEKDIAGDQGFYVTEDMSGELDYIKTSIQVDLLGMEDSLAGVPDSEEILEEVAA
jgi:hypothetical protein